MVSTEEARSSLHLFAESTVLITVCIQYDVKCLCKFHSYIAAMEPEEYQNLHLILSLQLISQSSPSLQ